MSNLFVNCAGI